MTFRRYEAYKDSGVAWLGEVPWHWDVRRLRYVAELNPSKSEVASLPKETLVSFLPMEAIGDDGSLDLERGRPITDLETGYTFFRDGDVTIAKITPCFENGKGAVMRGLRGGVGFGTTELIVARPRPTRTTSEYLHWWFTSEPFRKQGESHMYGAGGQKRVPDDFVRDFVVVMPGLAEQSAIAAFLDHETAKIDALVEEQKRLIELLKEKRQAVISRAVTKGLNPNAPMKDSGVEWLGEVPAHWGVIALKRLIALGSSISYGIVQPGTSLEDGVPFVQTTNMTSGDFEIESLQKTSPEIAAAYPRSQLSGGEVILGIRASIGACHVVPPSLHGYNLSRGVARIVCNARISSEFLVAYLKTEPVRWYWQLAKQGSTFNEVSIETVRELKVVVPPTGEQREIAEHAKAVGQRLDSLIAEAESAVALLQERRTALISAAVTGKIDVRASATRHGGHPA